jgi:hypothetical protein
MPSNQREANSLFIISKGVWDLLFDKCGRNQNCILCAFKKGLFWAKRRKSGYIPLTITVKNNSDYYDNVSATGCSENGKSFYAIIQTLLFAKTVSTICGFFIDNHRFKIDKSLSGDILAKDKRGAHSG